MNMEHALSRLAMLALAVVASTAIAAPVSTETPRCLPRSAQIIFGVPGPTRDADAVQYRDFTGRPVRGAAVVALCSDTAYRIVPGDGRCHVTVPKRGTTAEIRARIAKQIKDPRRCPPPVVTAVKSEVTIGSDNLPALRVVPAGTIDVRNRREVLVVVEGKSQYPPSPTPGCAATVPASGMTVTATLNAYRAATAGSSCTAVVARGWTGTVLVSAANPSLADAIVQHSWPSPGVAFDPDVVQPIMFLSGALLPPGTTPDLTGKTLTDARATAQLAGIPALIPFVDDAFVDDMAAGDRLVTAQRPAPGAPYAIGDKLVVVSPARKAPVRETSASLPVLVVGSALGGAAVGEVLRRVSRRREDAEPEGPTGTPQVTDRDGWRVRARPDIPSDLGRAS